MGLAGKSATFMRRARRSLHPLLALVLATSTLSAISVILPLPSASANIFTSPNSEFAFDFVDGASNTLVKTQNNVGPIPAEADFSVESWVFADSNSGNWHTIMVQDQGEDTGQGVGRFYLGFPTGGALHIGIAGQAKNVANIPLTAWTHVALTFTRGASTSTTRTYINGSLVDTSTWNNVSFSTASGFSVGTATDGGYEFDGKIDQVKVWNGVLSEADIQKSMFAYSSEGISSNTLRAHYDFNEGSGTTITDRTGNSQNMTVTLGSSSFWSINTDLVTEYDSSSFASNLTTIYDKKANSNGSRRNSDGTTNTTFGSKNSTNPPYLSQPNTSKELLITETSIVISQITTTPKTVAKANARIELIKKYIDTKSGSSKINFEVVPATTRTYFNNIFVKG